MNVSKGILGLDLFPILLGTIPVVLLIVPTVLTGSFAFMGSIEGDGGVDLYPCAGRYNVCFVMFIEVKTS